MIGQASQEDGIDAPDREIGESITDDGDAWLFAPGLPSTSRSRVLVEHYFQYHHPLRCFGFLHKPSFMRNLDQQAFTSKANRALLHIVCAIGARFYALDQNRTRDAFTSRQVQSAGSAWAKLATSMILGDYGNISVQNLMATLLLHDYEIGSGNHAQAFLLSALTARMATALQINLEYSTDILCLSQEEEGAPSPIEREERRRLMWACYDVDIWNGSGVDQLTLLNEKDIKIQLPCTSRDFLQGRACMTESLQRDAVLERLPREQFPTNIGIAAYYIRLVNIWKRMLQ